MDSLYEYLCPYVGAWLQYVWIQYSYIMWVGVSVYVVSPLIYLQKETLVHMLRYFDFLQSRIQTLQSRLPPHCIPKQDPDTGTTSAKHQDKYRLHTWLSYQYIYTVCVCACTGSESEENTPSEPCTPPHNLKAKRKYVCSRSRKRPAPSLGTSPTPLPQLPMTLCSTQLKTIVKWRE